MIWGQCDQIGRFLIALGNKFNHKSGPKKSIDLMGHFEKDSFM